MKKKFLVLILILMLTCLLTLSGCNKQIIDLNYEFTNAYVKIGDEWVDLEIFSWKDYEDGEQIQLKLRDGTVFIVHSANCVLYKGKLPIRGVIK